MIMRAEEPTFGGGGDWEGVRVHWDVYVNWDGSRMVIAPAQVERVFSTQFDVIYIDEEPEEEERP